MKGQNRNFEFRDSDVIERYIGCDQETRWKAYGLGEGSFIRAHVRCLGDKRLEARLRCLDTLKQVGSRMLRKEDIKKYRGGGRRFTVQEDDDLIAHDE